MLSALNPNFEKVSPKGNLDIFPCNAEHEGCPNAKSSEEHTSHDLQESMSFRWGETYGEKACCLDPCLSPLFPFDPDAKCGYDDAGTPNLLLGLHDKQGIILENPRANVSLSSWDNASK
ncbi:uncharacterized protein LOC124892650, partial [Capsicum annuum]|uniref:uncharacterized protein LOC124892650 n=1 Tax=Capsicum annuum TaxID=4072 RepID=UPI001FB170A1